MCPAMEHACPGNPCHHFLPTNSRRDADGGRFVLKRTLLESSRLEKRVRELHADAEAAALSGAAAAAFSGALHGVTEVSYLAGGRGGDIEMRMQQ